MLGDLANTGGGVLAHVQVGVSEALENIGEYLGLHHDLGEVHRVLGDLSQAAAHLFCLSSFSVLFLFPCLGAARWRYAAHTDDIVDRRYCPERNFDLNLT